MMTGVKKISVTKNFGCFEEFLQEEDFIYGQNNCNIIFGFNGSGKSTIAAIFSLFSNEKFLEPYEKQNIFYGYKNESSTHIELELKDTNKLKYPSSNSQNKNIYVFDKNFISSHVFSGENGKIKKFSTVKAEIKNDSINQINDLISNKEEEINIRQQTNNSLEQEYKKITSHESNVFASTLTDKNKKIVMKNIGETNLPIESPEELNETFEKLKSDYNLSKKQEQLKEDIVILESTNIEKPLVINIENISESLNTKLSQISKDILDKKINEIKKYFEDEALKKSVERWFKFGKDILLNVKDSRKYECPICDTDITDKIKALFENYEDYFDESYDKLISKIVEADRTITETIKNLKNIELSFQSIKTIHERYKTYLQEIELGNFDFNNLIVSLSGIQQALEAKNQNVQYMYSMPENINKEISNYYNFVDFVLKQKNRILDVLKSKNLVTNTIEEKIREICKKRILINFNLSQGGSAIENYKNNSNFIKKVKEVEIPKLKSDLSIELQKIKAESRTISKFLNKLGIDHFDIDIKEDENTENIIITYKKNGKQKNTLKNSLSEGERTALAFAYFLSKFEHEINSEEKINESLVVIDDPICSLDENILFRVALLINKSFSKSLQLVVLSHNFLFLKYFNSFFDGNAKCFFLNDYTLKKIPEEMKNFETPYFYMMKTLNDFLDENIKEVNYENSRKYLPNYLRRVLETFLNFKFCIISCKRNRSLGLNDFAKEEIKDMILPTVMEGAINNENLIEHINEIIRICDPYSHGNNQHTQESYYIPETTLKNIVKNGLDIIKFFDINHKFK